MKREPKTREQYEAEGWKEETCFRCGGHMVYASAMGEPLDCTKCMGGAIWRTPNGRYVAYPGGPFV